MANIVKYVTQTISVNGNNENLATNGFYIGQQKGTVTQDAAVDGIEPPYEVEYGTVRYGTMAQDATVGSMPDVGVGVKQNLTDCTSDVNDLIITKNAAKTFTYTAASGKALPDTVTVKIGGVEATSGTDYTYTKEAGTIAFEANKLNGDVEITVTAA